MLSNITMKAKSDILARQSNNTVIRKFIGTYINHVRNVKTR
jgi:hypothetical protein